MELSGQLELGQLRASREGLAAVSESVSPWRRQAG